MRKAAATMRKNGMQMKDRATGAMAGLALGDALGMPTQSMVGRADLPVLRRSDHETYECRAAAADRAEYESWRRHR